MVLPLSMDKRMYICRCGHEFPYSQFVFEGEWTKKCPACNVLEYVKNKDGRTVWNIHTLFKNVVLSYGWLDSAMDYYMTKIVYFNPLTEQFESADVIADTNYVVQEAPEEIIEAYKKQRIAESYRKSLVYTLVKKIDEFRTCPRCNGKLGLVKNKGFLWMMHRKGLCPPPFKQRIYPKGSCREKAFVLYCRSCNVNYTVQNYHRDYQIVMIKNLEEKGMLQIYSGMDGITTKLTFPLPQEVG